MHSYYILNLFVILIDSFIHKLIQYSILILFHENSKFQTQAELGDGWRVKRAGEYHQVMYNIWNQYALCEKLKLSLFATIIFLEQSKQVKLLNCEKTQNNFGFLYETVNMCLHRNLGEQ